MSQRAIIGINGDLIPFDQSVAKLRTPGIGTGPITWLPGADTECTALTVTANGTYSAADAGKYGYDEINVSVPGTSVTGTINGVEYRVTVDSSGNLVYTRI